MEQSRMGGLFSRTGVNVLPGLVKKINVYNGLDFLVIFNIKKLLSPEPKWSMLYLLMKLF